MQMKSTVDDQFATSLTVKYGGLKFHDIDGPLNGFSSALNGFTLEHICCILWKLNENASETLTKGYGYKYCILISFHGYDINEHHRQPQKYWSLQEMYKCCDFYSMVQDYYGQHPEEAEEMGLKVYRDDGVLEEITELEAFKSGQSPKRKRSDGREQVDKHKTKRKG